MDATIEKPDIVSDEQLDYLDELRESAVTNMFVAGSYLRDEFGLTKQEARAVLTYWMQTFPRNK